MKEYYGEDIKKAINNRQNKVINSINKSFIQNESTKISNDKNKLEPTEKQIEEQKAKDLDNERRGKK